MANLSPNLANFLPIAKKLMRLIAPYADQLIVLARQEDTMCIYTPGKKSSSSRLFAAVQIVAEGVSFTVYDPGKNHRYIFDNLPPRLNRSYRGNFKFLIQRFSVELATEISSLLSALYGLYSIEILGESPKE